MPDSVSQNNTGVPRVLLLYYRGDRDMFDKVFSRLEFLNESGVMEVRPWYLTDIHVDDELDRTDEEIKAAQIVVVLVSSPLLHLEIFHRVVLRELFGDDAPSRVVLPVMLSPLYNRDFLDFQEYFKPVWEDVFPADHRALFFQHTEEQFTHYLVDLMDILVERMGSVLFPLAERDVSERNQVYIAYSRADYPAALLVRLRLAALHVPVWMDRFALRGQQNWGERVDRAIRDSRALVLLLSEAAQRSEYVCYEWAFAFGARCEVIPLMVEQVEKLHPRLCTCKVLTWYYHPRSQYPWDELRAALRRARLKPI